MDSKLKYYLQLADNAMVMSKRMREAYFSVPSSIAVIDSESYAHQLEQMAQEIYLETSHWQVENRLRYSDWLHKRQSSEFFNCLLVEIDTNNPHNTFVQYIFFESFLYLFLFDSFFREDIFLRNLAEKYLPYFYNQTLQTDTAIEQMKHFPAELKLNIQAAVLELWTYVLDLFQVSMADIEMYACEQGVDFSELRKNWELKMSKMLGNIQVQLPLFEPLKIIGKEGQHTQNLEFLLHGHH